MFVNSSRFVFLIFFYGSAVEDCYYARWLKFIEKEGRAEEF